MERSLRPRLTCLQVEDAVGRGHGAPVEEASTHERPSWAGDGASVSAKRLWVSMHSLMLTNVTTSLAYYHQCLPCISCECLQTGTTLLSRPRGASYLRAPWRCS